MNRRGVSLIELLITMIIASIALVGLSVPFVAERAMWGTGRQQAEAQRDAEVVLRTIARAAREGSNPTPLPGASSNTFTFQLPSCGGAAVSFAGGPLLGGQLTMADTCAVPPAAVTLIDGVRSQVTELVFTGVASPGTNTRRMGVRIRVTHQGLEDELLETEILLRNAT